MAENQHLPAIVVGTSAGAGYFAVNVLFLMPSAQKAFFPFLQEQFPHLAQRYRRLYSRSAYLRGPYSARLGQLVERLRRKYGLTGAARPYRAETFAPAAQMALFDTNLVVAPSPNNGVCRA